MAENYVERDKGRPKFFAHATAFTLAVWPLVVRELTPDEARRRAGWLRRQCQEQGSNNASPLSTAIELEADGFEEHTELQQLPDYADSLLLDEHDLASSPDSNGSSLRLQYLFEIPPWAYIVRIRAGKTSLGKRAVQRNRAKRRIRAAANQICPDHASRGREYVFTANPEALTIDFRDLVDEVISALKKARSWEDSMTEDMLRRKKYCSR